MPGVAIPVRIRLKRSKVDLLEDSIPIYGDQIDRIRKQSYKKTFSEWKSPSTRGIKIPLTLSQQKKILELKDKVIESLTPSRDPEELILEEDYFGFASHAFLRVLQRIERLSDEDVEALGDIDYSFAVHPETLTKLTAALINSREVEPFATWKASPYLNFGFICDYDDRKLRLITNFENGILVVTVIVEMETGYFVKESFQLKSKNTSLFKK